MRLARLDACIVLSPLPSGLIERGPLKISMLLSYKYLCIETSEFFVRDWMHLLQSE